MDLIIFGVKHLLAVISGITLLVFPANSPPPNLPSPAPIAQQIIYSPSPTPSPISSPNPTSSSVVNPSQNPTSSDVITTSGEYSYLGQGVTYTVSFPKNGGDVHGSLGGMCHDSFINGKFEGGDGGKIQGTIFAWCGIAFLQQRVIANYTGNVYLKDGRIDVNWEGNTQSSWGRGSYTLKFNP